MHAAVCLGAGEGDEDDGDIEKVGKAQVCGSRAAAAE